MSTGIHVVELLRRALWDIRLKERAVLAGEWPTEQRPDFGDKQLELPIKERTDGHS